MSCGGMSIKATMTKADKVSKTTKVDESIQMVIWRVDEKRNKKRKQGRSYFSFRSREVLRHEAPRDAITK